MSSLQLFLGLIVGALLFLDVLYVITITLKPTLKHTIDLLGTESIT